MTLSPQERELAARLSFDEQIFLTIKQDIPVEFKYLELKHYWYESNEHWEFDESIFPDYIRIARNQKVGSNNLAELKMEGVFFEVPSQQTIPLIFQWREKLSKKEYCPITLDYKYRQQLLGEDLLVSLHKLKNRSLVAIVKFLKPDDLIIIFGTDGCNYGVGNNDILNKLRYWKKLCDFEILGAGHDRLNIAFRTLPEELETFAQDVYKFCPDIIDQNYVGEPLGEEASQEDISRAFHEQTVEDLIEFIQRNKLLNFWWD